MRYLWLVVLTSCTHVCTKTWEVRAEYSVIPMFGPSQGLGASVGGEVGKGCRE